MKGIAIGEVSAIVLRLVASVSIPTQRVRGKNGLRSIVIGMESRASIKAFQN
jgi:hypothetical protein